MFTSSASPSHLVTVSIVTFPARVFSDRPSKRYADRVDGPPSSELEKNVRAVALCSTLRNGAGGAGRFRTSLRAGLNFQRPENPSSDCAAPIWTAMKEAVNTAINNRISQAYAIELRGARNLACSGSKCRAGLHPTPDLQLFSLGPGRSGVSAARRCRHVCLPPLRTRSR